MAVQVMACASVLSLLVQSAAVAGAADAPPPVSEAAGPPEGGPGFGGPSPFGPGDFGPGGAGPMGFGGMKQQDIELVKQFDKDGDKRLNNAERKAAREYLGQQGGNRRRGGVGGRRGGFGGPGESLEPAQPGPRVTPADVTSFAGAPLYASNVLRTFFLEFENADWEKELEDFHGTDVEVPAKLTVDGKTYPDVGVHFRGASSYMMVGTGRKRSLNLSLDFAHEDQQIGGYRTLNLLNSHGDPSFLRTVLYHDIARGYLPAPKANWVRLVINGESWGVYVSLQQFNKDFVKEWFGTRKGARWKAPGSPNGRGSLAYLGDNPASYKGIYEIKSKDDAKSWADLIRLCKVLNETPAAQLETALAPLLDVDGALRFLALENALINNDGYWVRTSDYDLYQDERGRFHIIPYDANETFSLPGGPGFGGPGGFAPGMLLAGHILAQADKDGNQKLSPTEFAALAQRWFETLDSDKTGQINQERFSERLSAILPPPPGPQGFGGPGADGPRTRQRRGGTPGGFGPAMFLGQGLFAAVDANKDGVLTGPELRETFARWFGQWDKDMSGALDEAKVRNGLSAVLPGPGNGPGLRGPGFGRGLQVNGVELDPLIAASDSSKPLISKLLAVPSLRARYLACVQDIADKWLDWKVLGPRVAQYQALLAAEVKTDTRKFSSYEAFQRSATGDIDSESARGPERTISLKSFAEKRRAYLLGLAPAKPTARKE
jgi:hypothetical protein